MTKSPILIVGDHWGEEDAKRGEPFVGAAGKFLHSSLRLAGIDSRDCHFTNVLNFQPPGNDIKNCCGPKEDKIPFRPKPIFAGKYLKSKYAPELTRLYDEIAFHQPNIIIALGVVALWALTGQTGIKKLRGTLLLTPDTEVKLLPTYHPGTIFRQFKARPIFLADLEKARRHSTSPELIRPQRFIHIPETIEDIRDFYQTYILDKVSEVSCDIETAGTMITEVGIAPTTDRALVIPFYSRRQTDKNYWRSLKDEIFAWEFIRMILARYPSCGQNYQYDMKYLWKQMGIPTPLVSDDTMIMHHTLQPEMEKSLGFLGSLYTDEPSWKFMRADAEDARTKKKED